MELIMLMIQAYQAQGPIKVVPRVDRHDFFDLHMGKTNQYLVSLSKVELDWLEVTLKSKHPNVNMFNRPQAKSVVAPTEVPTPVLNVVETSILSKIIGQDAIIKEVLSKCARYFIRIPSDETKPLSFFFAGPTGVGKTETAKLLAKELGMGFLRIDMSEYQDKHNVARMIGSPPGYTGHGQKGVLSDVHEKAVVLLFDEIEKADNQMMPIFLQMLDYGVLTEGTGNKIDLSKCIIIMTSNIGAADMMQRDVGIETVATNETRQGIVKRAMDREFSPEFINRLSSIQIFNALNKDQVKTIVDNKLDVIVKEISEHHGVDLDLSEELKEKLYTESYDPLMGARPVTRALEKLVLEPTAKDILEYVNN